MLFSRKAIEKKDSNTTLASIVEQLLTQKEFRYTVLDSGTFKTGIKGDHLTWQVYIHADEERKLISIRSVLPLFIEDNQKLNIVDLLNRINYQILLGKWSMDNEDGEVSCSMVQLADAAHLSLEQLNIMLNTNLRTVDEYFPAIASVNFGNMAPVIAFNSIP